MQDVWIGISQELERLGELERFVQSEIPIQTLMGTRQWKGISVNTGESAKLLAQAKAEKYRAMLEVGATLRINPTGLTYQSVLPYLDGTDAAVLQAFSESPNLASYFKLAASESRIPRQFRSMINENRNIKALLALATSNGRVFPVLDTMATVSARIQTSMPNLQQIRKTYRGALQVDHGMHDVYLDFSQFEPGILAQLVGPGPYRDLYNAGDVYKELGQTIFGNTSKRELAKQVFIAFCYGMDLRSIARLLRDATRTDGYSVEAISCFFSQFPELMEFKQACELKLQTHGFVLTALGNRRVRIRTGPLSRRERGWAMNQPVQGTGSLILKDSLLRLASRFGDDAILLPMHDAVWLQLPQHENGFMDAPAREAIILMESVARKWCREVRFRVKATSFAETLGDNSRMTSTG
jgi:DNA polymerase I